MYYVYIILCSDEKTYVGCTSDLKKRLEKHRLGYVPATRARIPFQLINYFAFSNKNKAFQFEKYLKSGSGRAFTKKHFL